MPSKRRTEKGQLVVPSDTRRFAFGSRRLTVEEALFWSREQVLCSLWNQELLEVPTGVLTVLVYYSHILALRNFSLRILTLRNKMLIPIAGNP